VMFEAVKAFEPVSENKAFAVAAAITEGENYTRMVGDVSGNSKPFDPRRLAEAAEEVWILYMGVMHSKLLPKEVRETLPALYAQENNPDPVVYIKFFTPDSSWTWFAWEFDGLNIFYGLVIGHEEEPGFFLLSELEETTGPMGLHIERDLYFQPAKLSQVRKEYATQRGQTWGLGLIVGGLAHKTAEVYDSETEVNPETTEDNPYPIAAHFVDGHFLLRQWNGHDWEVAINNRELEELVLGYVTGRFLLGESGSWYPVSKEIAQKARFPVKGDLYDAQITKEQTL